MIVIGVLIVGLAGLGLAGQSGSIGRPAHTTQATPAPTSSPFIGEPYDAVFTGDPTGATDVTKALRTFLQAHDGERVALARNGTYKVTQLSFTANGLTLDFRGSRIEASKAGAYGIFLIQASSDITINDASIVGTGYEWVGGDANPQQWEHGIEIDGGSNITLNSPMTRNTRGDGIYVGFETDKTVPPANVIINDPNIEYASRNGIAPVAGEVSIIGGHIANIGLHGIDFEPNNDAGALSIIGLVDGVDIRNVNDLDVAGLTGVAVAAAGFSSASKPSITIQHVTGDKLEMIIPDTAVVIIRNNTSDTNATADLQSSGQVTFTGNVRITRK